MGHHPVRAVIDSEHNGFPLKLHGELTVFGPHRVVHAVDFAGVVALQIVSVSHKDGVRFAVVEANKQLDVTDVLAGDIDAQQHGPARSSDTIGQGDRGDADLTRPWAADGCTRLGNGYCGGSRLEGATGVVIGQEIVPQGGIGKAARHRRIRLGAG